MRKWVLIVTKDISDIYWSIPCYKKIQSNRNIHTFWLQLWVIMNYAWIIDIHQRSQTYTATCNGVISRGAQIGDLRVFADHTRKKHTQNKCSHDFRAAFYACLSSCSDRGRCRWHTHLTNHGYFDYRKNLKTPILSPMPESRWRRFWDLWCISTRPNYSRRYVEVALTYRCSTATHQTHIAGQKNMSYV